MDGGASGHGGWGERDPRDASVMQLNYKINSSVTLLETPDL